MLQQRNMGDSSACLMQPFCYSSNFPNEANNKRNPINALGESVSFGRFMTESLAWEKWSTFSSSHNRYVEEAERISRPGSVAQKKAFFEAHYKKLAAQKAAAASQAQQEQEAEIDNNTINSTSKLVVNEENARTSNIDTSLPQSQNNKVDGAQLGKEHQTFRGNSMLNQHEDVGKASEKHLIDTPKSNLIRKGSNFDKEVLQSMAKKKAPISSLDVGTSKSAPTVSDRDNIATPNPIRKKISNAKSLHMSLKFAFIREINRLTASVMRKLETTRVGAGSSTASVDSWTPLTPKTKVSMNELQKHPSFTTLTEKYRNSMTSQIISSPFGLRTEERDASGKKKLGKKTNASEAQKRKLHIKLKEKTVIKIRNLRQSFCFKPRPLSEFDNEKEVSKNLTKEDSLTPSGSPKLGRRSTLSVVTRKSSLSPGRLFHENTSPNIQHGNQNDSNY